MLTDNAWAYAKNTWRTTCHELGISPRWTRPWRPQTNGKVERFRRTRRNGPTYSPTPQKPNAKHRFDWLDWFNYHRPHTGISGQASASRVNNVPEQRI
ncbi:integrase core domain-containing protein [Streptomyces chartreusis]|uniref:integrase core domain-containing protein n=1 Tax=Streptomyces chartreusis TaxID=1969 RepID=UPI0033F6571B